MTVDMPRLTLQRLNMDTSWHCSLGQLKLLIDPWLMGTEVDFFGWFNTQWHRTPPIAWPDLPEFNAVLVTQKYPDHCHPLTLQRLQPQCVIAPDHLTRRIQTLLPETTAIGVSAGGDGVYQAGVNIHLLGSSRRAGPVYEAFLLDDGHHSVLIAPHGLEITEEHIDIVLNASPLKLLLAPFDQYQLPALLGGSIKPGLRGLEVLIERFNPEFVVQTHDENKHARGLVSVLARVTPFNNEDLANHPWLAKLYHPVPTYQPVTF